MEAQTAPADVEISIVSLGDAEQLSRCVEGLPAACRGLDWRLSVVDNSPAGLALGPILDGLPATVVRSVGRRGFAANQNLVLRSVVQDSRARYVLVLNDDTEVDADAVVRLVRHAEVDPRIGAVTPSIRDGCGTREPDLFAWPVLWDQALRALLPRLTPRAPRGSGWLNGAAMLVRTACLQDVGLLDPSFFLFFEETDLCLRMTMAGWRLDVCQDASLVHRRHGTTGQALLKREIEEQMLRSRYLFFAKHHGRARARMLAALTRCALLLRAATAAATATARGSEEARHAALVLWRLAAYAPTRPTELELPHGR